MKKKFKFIIIGLIVIFIFIINIEISEAGFADFTDEQAEKSTQKMIEEQKQNYDMSKSNNNFLKSLKIEGYEFTPEFDKQTLEYYLNIPDDINEITVEADADDDKASVEGIGKVKVESEKTEYRIDVTAQSGTVRTYILKINDKDQESKSEDSLIKNDENIEVVSNVINNLDNSFEDKEHDEEKKSGNIIIVVIILIIIISIIVIIIIASKNRHKAKRRK